MPLLHNAKKKLRQDKKRTIHNRKIKDTLKELLKKAKSKKTPETISKAFSSIDKAVKHHIIHKNKAARTKASLSKLLSSPKAASTPAQ
ncbi:30S ribosomal protein S20 [Patescibacteria group bacterium]|nr:30S ribosomal protein S20 [Patescibacteria group bacterium]MBU4016150.1 30S ribosomal protein S20 [Patescibacteria group bacterium]MBU4099038.1 30S ribosomal protein S20 [Patescibacteria group bacterium]